MSTQSQHVHVKTIAPPCFILRLVHSIDKDAAVAWASHPAEGSTPRHTHFVVRFTCVKRWYELRARLMFVDPHSYSDAARSFRRSVRYLLHLDNPEKVRIPANALHTSGIDSDEVSQLLGNPKLDILDYLPDVVKRKPVDGLRFLLERGFSFSEVSGAVNALSALSRYRDMSRRANHSGTFADDDFIPDSFGCDESEVSSVGGMGGLVALPYLPHDSVLAEVEDLCGAVVDCPFPA